VNLENENKSVECKQDIENLELKDIKSVFYTNSSLNDDLESEFRKPLGDARVVPLLFEVNKYYDDYDKNN